MRKRILPFLSDEKAGAILSSLCQEHNINLALLRSLIEIQRDNLGRGKQVGISQEFSAALSEFIDAQSEKSNASD